MQGYLTVFADASFCDRSKAAGVAFWVRDDVTKISRAFPVTWEVSSSNEAETTALASGMLTAIDKLVHAPGHILVAESDCLHALQQFDQRTGATEVESWLVQYVLKEMLRHGIRLKLKHVKGHSGKSDARSWVNHWCDKAAREQMQKQRARKELAPGRAQSEASFIFDDLEDDPKLVERRLAELSQ